jgi:hypothetical protein
MKRGTIAIVLLLALGSILSMGFTSWVDPFGMSGPRGHHWGHSGHHGKFAQLTPEEAGKLFQKIFSYRMAIVKLHLGETKEEAWRRHFAEHPEDIKENIKVFNSSGD